MRSTDEMLRDEITGLSLNILVFGPQVSELSDNERTRNLQLKRIQIKNELERMGHIAKYAEELVNPNLSAPVNNVFLQEILIMEEYDLIVTIVDSPGSITEATVIAQKPDFAKKASLFLDKDYSSGLTADACRFAKDLGADFQMYQYPDDLVDCHLLGFIKKRVGIIQTIKFLS